MTEAISKSMHTPKPADKTNNPLGDMEFLRFHETLGGDIDAVVRHHLAGHLGPGGERLVWRPTKIFLQLGHSVTIINWELPLLPGGYLLQSLLFVNLMVGGMIRMSWDLRRAGILLTHFGMALLLIAGFVKAEMSNEGGLALFEGDASDQYYDHFRWELVVGKRMSNGVVREYRWFEDQLTDGLPLQHAELPFQMDIDVYHENCSLVPTSVPMVAAEFLPTCRLMAGV